MILIVAGLGCIAVGLAGLVYARVKLSENRIELKRHTVDPEVAVLIPAREESEVIGGLFESLRRQSVKVRPENVFVIVETAEDPTVQLAREYGYDVIVRRKLRGRGRKGFALDEAIKQILARRGFDLYFIFDADNILTADYIERMLQNYAEGYEIVTGYRNIKNCQPNVVAAASSLTFSMLNALSNHDRIKYGANVVFSGTGCFVDGALIDEWRGWPFQTLTEDYELSLYAASRRLATYYNEQAVFFDEQPQKFGQTFLQRVRWIRGYFDARKIYVPVLKKRIKQGEIASKKCPKAANCMNVSRQSYSKKAIFGSMKREIVGVKPVIWLVVGLVLLILGILVRAFYAQGLGETLLYLLLILGVVYVVLMGLTIYLLWREKLDLPRKVKAWTVFYNPLYLATYVPCALKAIFTKRVEWSRIEHTENTAQK